MTPIFANSATVTVPERLVLSGGAWRPVTLGVRYGVWVHPTEGPVLIDTGYGPEITTGRRSLALRLYAAVIHPTLADMPETVLAGLGFTAADVRTIVITHFHADHVSGLKRFPKARFIAAGWAGLKAQSQFQHLRHGVFTELLPLDFEDRLTAMESLPSITLPLGPARDIFGDGSLLALDLPGHALGHTGLVWPDQKLLYAADAQWLRRAVTDNRPPRGPARLVYHDEAAMQDSLLRLRQAEALGYNIVFCHDDL